jgi:pimeloyl-ACP methyl ester carboxylesterase
VPEITLPQGSTPLPGGRSADGPTVFLVHGILVDGRIWDRVIPSSRRPACASSSRTSRSAATACRWPRRRPEPRRGRRAPRRPARGARPPGRPRSWPTTRAGLHAGPAGSDHPGARRVTALVLAAVDGLEIFPPKVFRGLEPLGPGALRAALLARVLGAAGPRRLLYRAVSRAGIPDELDLRLGRAAAHGSRRSSATWRRSSPTRTSGGPSTPPPLSALRRPVLLVWAARDPFFPPDLAVRLAACFRDARIACSTGRASFVPVGPARRARPARHRPRGGRRRTPARPGMMAADAARRRRGEHPDALRDVPRRRARGALALCHGRGGRRPTSSARRC